MAETGRWRGHVFEVSPTLIRPFSDLSITGSSEVEDKVSDEQKYVRRVSGNAAEVSLKAILNAYLGCDVRAEAMAFIEDATAGETGYFYVGGRKLLPEELMLTEARTEEIEIAPDGTWTRCAVSLTMKQSGKGSGSGGSSSSSGSSSGGGKPPEKNSVKPEAEKIVEVAAGAVKDLAAKASQYLIDAAKRREAAEKQSKAIFSGGGGAQKRMIAKE